MPTHFGPRLLALDWGTSNLRASLLGARGAVLAVRRNLRGVMTVQDGGFEAVVRELCGDWLAAQPALPVLACGMVGSRMGWREVPYLSLPAGVGQAAAALCAVALGGHRLFIVPGVASAPRPGRWDVMRGEETQVWGAAWQAGWSVLPGTHSKWVQLDAQGGITGLYTCMTGELYALLSQHGTLSRLMVHGTRDDAAFAGGVTLGAAEHAQALHALFAARTVGLLGGLAAGALPDYLSGLLIGMEIAGMRALLGEAAGEAAPPLTLIGEAALCERYQRALRQCGLQAQAAAEGAAEAGLWRIACAAGIVDSSAG